MNKIISLSALTILIFGMVGCGVSQPNENTVYQNDEFGFQIELPESAKGYTTNVDNNPIPPEAVQTIGFLLNGNGFLSIEVYTNDEWDKIANKLVFVDPKLVIDEESTAKTLSEIFPNQEYEEILEKVNNKTIDEFRLLSNAPQSIIDDILSENLDEFDVIEGDTIVLYPQKIKDKEVTSSIIKKYMPGMSEKGDLNLTGENRYEVIAENATPEIASKLKDADLAGVGFEDDRMGTINKDGALYILAVKQTSGGTPDSYQLSEDEFLKVKGSFKLLE